MAEKSLENDEAVMLGVAAAVDEVVVTSPLAVFLSLSLPQADRAGPIAATMDSTTAPLRDAYMDPPG
ncbi:MAG TPA: hypothetical protein VHL53_16705 [Acidimicrobiia bacterium]|nr:hypothetical protein [Acidimicrobiia bacterium]